VLRTRRQPGEAQPVQELADRALVQLDLVAIDDDGLQVDPAPAHHAIPLRVRTALDEPLHFRHLLRRQARRPSHMRPVAQAGKTLGIVAAHPIPQSLPIHSAQPRRFGARAPVQHQGQRQHPASGCPVVTTRRFMPEIIRAPIQTRDRHCHQPAPAPAKKSESESQLNGERKTPIRRVTHKGRWY
jgi:hypothetical protein